MFKTYRFAVFMLFTVFLCSCQQFADKYQDHFWVISDSAGIYERPEAATKMLKELKLGADLYCREKNPSYSVPRGWIEAKSGDVRGFIEKKRIAGEDVYKEIQGLIDRAKDVSAQATGLTKGKVSLRLKPEKGAFVIKSLKEPGRVDVLQRIVFTISEKEKAKKQIWYKIRLDDGYVGFVTANNVELTPPGELNMYTQARTPISWYKLNEKEDPKTGEKGSDYLVTYSSVGSDVGTDFTRIELYTYDLRTKSYATSLARSNLYGILPVKITDEENNKKVIEIKEHPKGNQTKIHVIQYSFPSPIKVVKDYVEDAGKKEE